ncbi:S-layer protein [Nostocaceae cyanobacterium CENA369]|uniref:S-layer protein n=1 Tax=Dendronalium phyllosphericum CENA369 TaxID=1725256 RepID=A0A8J7I261_9NOST|nr:S-layer protein [Dendronalium phyllosphericum]MBH8571581.1 S-layer protein [Dendronalium phyllosphericum CENA369]
MNVKILATAIVVLGTIGVVVPVQAQDINNKPTNSNQVLNACIQNRAETLPNPYSDVSPDHWAFKAVMTMHYCGAFRQATPPALFEKLQPTENQQPQQREQQFQK